MTSPERTKTLRALVCVTVLATACLPTGDPPVGRQVIAGRDRLLVGVLPARSPDDGVLRLLVTRPNVGAYDFELSAISLPAAGGAPSEHLLFERWYQFGCFSPEGGACIPVDNRGRLLLSAIDRPGAFLVDPDTGDRQELGDSAALSPSGDRIAGFRYGPPSTIELREADDRTTVLAEVPALGMFIGEDFYYGDNAQRLLRVTPGGVPEVLREGITSFSSVVTTEGLLLMLRRPSSDPQVGDPMSLFDPVTREERPLAIDPIRFSSLSPDGRWAVLLAPDFMGYRLMEVATGAEQDIEISGNIGALEWRPGRTELWWVTYANVSAYPFATTWIKRPGMPAGQVPAMATGLADTSTTTYSIFTSDGRYWFSGGTVSDRGTDAVKVGLADAPNGARFDLMPANTTRFGYRPLADGRLLIEISYTSSFDRRDIFAVDPTTGASTLLGKQGRVLEKGDRRVLANLRLVDGFGDLTVIDLDRGSSTVLATEFAQVGFVQRQGSDPDLVKPGAPIAFQFRARFASPYDGIWLATLP